MKNKLCWVTVAVLVLCFGANVHADSGTDSPAPMMSATPMVPMKKDAEVFIMGSGFRPGQEIKVLYTDPSGVPADIAYALKTRLVADNQGQWKMIWKCGEYINRKLIQEGVTTLTAADNEYNVLAHDSVLFYKGELSIPEKLPMTTATPMVRMKKDAEVLIMGSGFSPGQEIRALFKDSSGVSADITSALKTKLVADNQGRWKMIWNCGEYISKKLIEKGVTHIAVTDSDYTVLAHHSIYFYVE